MRPLGLIDGKIVELGGQLISMEDRGYQFGDGVYEVTKVYNGSLFALKPHLERLFRSLRELRIEATYTFAELESFHRLLIQESGIPNGGVYLQITRGAAPRVHNFPEKVTPCLTMSIRPAAQANVPLWENGAKAIFVPDERWLRCDIKSLNLLGNVLAKQQAKEAGCFEAVMVRDGFLTEGTSSNFFVVKDGELWTYPVSNLILKGVTRTILIDELAPSLDLKINEQPFDTAFAKKADEMFLCGTTTEIMPIITVDGVPVADGKVGAITRKLQAGYNKLIDQECKRNC